MNSSKLKTDILYLSIQMSDLVGDLICVINAIEKKQITKKEVKSAIKNIIKNHNIKIYKLNSLLKKLS